MACCRRAEGRSTPVVQSRMARSIVMAAKTADQCRIAWEMLRGRHRWGLSPSSPAVPAVQKTAEVPNICSLAVYVPSRGDSTLAALIRWRACGLVGSSSFKNKGPGWPLGPLQHSAARVLYCTVLYLFLFDPAPREAVFYIRISSRLRQSVLSLPGGSRASSGKAAALIAPRCLSQALKQHRATAILADVVLCQPSPPPLRPSDHADEGIVGRPPLYQLLCE